MEFKPELFDPWATSYDDEVASESGFPFAGYAELFKAIQDEAHPQAGQ